MFGRLKRAYFAFRLFLMNGWGRAEYLKKKCFLKSQGSDCYFAIYNFGTEPWLVSVGDNV